MTTQAEQAESIAKARQSLWRLVVDELVDKRQEKIIKNARDIIKAYFSPFNDNLTGPKPSLERKQVTNLELVTGETRSVPLIADFVRYQMGRDDKARTWRVTITLVNKQALFGDTILQQIEIELKETAQTIVNEARRKNIMPDDESSEVVFIWWLLVRRFVSYLEHAFVFEETEYKNKRERAMKAQREQQQ